MRSIPRNTRQHSISSLSVTHSQSLLSQRSGPCYYSLQHLFTGLFWPGLSENRWACDEEYKGSGLSLHYRPEKQASGWWSSWIMPLNAKTRICHVITLNVHHTVRNWISNWNWISWFEIQVRAKIPHFISHLFLWQWWIALHYRRLTVEQGCLLKSLHRLLVV